MGAMKVECREMNARPRLYEFLVLGACAFVLTQAVLSLVLPAGETPTEGNDIWKMILIVGYLGVVIILVPFYRETLYLMRRNWFVVALVLLALVSCFWAAMPALVFRRSVAALGATLVGFAFAIRLLLEDQLRLMSWVFRIIAALSLACIVLLPRYGISDSLDGAGQWQGVFGHKNGLGSFMALSILVEWYRPAGNRFSRVLKLLALFLSSILLFFSGSLTPLVALGAALLLTQGYKFSTQNLHVPLYAFALALILTIVFGATLLFSDSERITSALGRSSDLTGRAEIWSLVVPHILERPVYGYGFSGFWNGASPESAQIDRVMGTMIMYSHNGYLEILLNLGVLGFILALICFATGLQRAVFRSKLGHSRLDLWPFALLTYVLFHNMGECTILAQDLEWSLCVASIVSADRLLFAIESESESDFPLVLAEESQ
jgi:exopolysaccharide production protein ExoQ